MRGDRSADPGPPELSLKGAPQPGSRWACGVAARQTRRLCASPFTRADHASRCRQRRRSHPADQKMSAGQPGPYGAMSASPQAGPSAAQHRAGVQRDVAAKRTLVGQVGDEAVPLPDRGEDTGSTGARWGPLFAEPLMNTSRHTCKVDANPGSPPRSVRKPTPATDTSTDPMRALTAWFDDAWRSRKYDDFNAMTLATATQGGAPSARIVLCKSIELDPPALVFFTSYESRKGRELSENPRAAGVFYWPHAGRQVRVEGAVSRTSDEESDAYFLSRPLLSRLGACASRQSEPLSSRRVLLTSAAQIAAGALVSGQLSRPPRWGGYRLHLHRLELWRARSGRLHDRVRWTRLGTPEPAWIAERLNP